MYDVWQNSQSSLDVDFKDFKGASQSDRCRACVACPRVQSCGILVHTWNCLGSPHHLSKETRMRPRTEVIRDSVSISLMRHRLNYGNV